MRDFPGWSSFGERTPISGNSSAIITVESRDGVETLLCITLEDDHRVSDALRRAFPESRSTFFSGACHIRLPLRHRESSWPEPSRDFKMCR